MKDKLQSLKLKLQRKLLNSNGIDQLGRDVCFLSLILAFMNLFFKNALLSLFSFVGYLYSLFRIFSTDKGKRRRENQNYLTYCWRIKNKIEDHKKYKYFKCPHCKQKLRVPRGQGKIEVHCPKCDTRFDKRS